MRLICKNSHNLEHGTEIEAQNYWKSMRRIHSYRSKLFKRCVTHIADERRSNYKNTLTHSLTQSTHPNRWCCVQWITKYDPLLCYVCICMLYIVHIQFVYLLTSLVYSPSTPDWKLFICACACFVVMKRSECEKLNADYNNHMWLLLRMMQAKRIVDCKLVWMRAIHVG